MKPLGDAREGELVWVHPDPLQRCSELRGGDGCLATLRYRGLGGGAIGEADGAQWAFARRGFLHPRVEVREGSAVSPTATVDFPFLGWRGRPATIQLPQGPGYLWDASSGWGLEGRLVDPQGAVLLCFRRPKIERPWSREGKPECFMDLGDAARSRRDLPLLVLLGRFLAS